MIPEANAPCRIALAGPEDIEAVLALYRAAARTPGTAWNEYYPSREFAAGDIARGSLYCLWGEDGSLWGAASCGEPDEDILDLPCWDGSVQHPWELTRVGVLPERQGRGLAGQLLRHILADAARQGVDAVRLLVSRDNPAAVALYRKLGFAAVGTWRMYEVDWICQEVRLETDKG